MAEKQQTAMQTLKEDLKECSSLAKENLSDIKNDVIKNASIKLVESIFSKIINRIDTELLQLEKQQMFDYINKKYCIGEKSLDFHKKEFEKYFEETFKSE